MGGSSDWSNAFWSSARAWTVVDFSGAGTSNGLFTTINLTADSQGQSLASARPGAGFTMEKIGQDIVLNYAPVPEPSTLAIFIGAGIFAIGYGLFRKTRPAGKT